MYKVMLIFLSSTTEASESIRMRERIKYTPYIYLQPLILHYFTDKITKANILRTVVIYYFGGVFFDLDVVGVRPMDRFFRKPWMLTDCTRVALWSLILFAMSSVSEFVTRIEFETNIGSSNVAELLEIRLGVLITLLRLLSKTIWFKWRSFGLSKFWLKSPTIIIFEGSFKTNVKYIPKSYTCSRRSIYST